MTRWTRLYRFPGGMLELESFGDDDEDFGGFILEFDDSIALDGHDYRGVVMDCKPICLGYLRVDVSGIARLWEEWQIRRLAERFGYDFAALIVYDPVSGQPPLARLKARAARLDAEAVIVPSPTHFENGEVPRSLVQQVDVITVCPEATYARYARPLGVMRIE